MDPATYFIQCLNSPQYGLLLFLVAPGLTLIFGIMGVISLAHGGFYMLVACMARSLAPIVGAVIASDLPPAVGANAEVQDAFPGTAHH